MALKGARMPRKNQNARHRWKPSPERLGALEFGTPAVVATPNRDLGADFGLVIGAGALVFGAYCFVANFVLVMMTGLLATCLAVI